MRKWESIDTKFVREKTWLLGKLIKISYFYLLYVLEAFIIDLLYIVLLFTYSNIIFILTLIAYLYERRGKKNLCSDLHNIANRNRAESQFSIDIEKEGTF